MRNLHEHECKAIDEIRNLSDEKKYEAILERHPLVSTQFSRQENNAVWLHLHIAFMNAQLNLGQNVQKETLENISSATELQTMGESANSINWSLLCRLNALGCLFSEKGYDHRALLCHELVFEAMNNHDIRMYDAEEKETYLDHAKALLAVQLQANRPIQETLNKFLSIAKTMEEYNHDITEKWKEAGNWFFEMKLYNEAERCYQTSFDLSYLCDAYPLGEMGAFLSHLAVAHPLIKSRLAQHKDITAVSNRLLNEVTEQVSKIYRPAEYDEYYLKGCVIHRMESHPLHLDLYKKSFIYSSRGFYHVNAEGEAEKLLYINFHSIVSIMNKDPENNTCRLSKKEFTDHILQYNLYEMRLALTNIPVTLSKICDPDLFNLTVKYYLKAYELALKIKDLESATIWTLQMLAPHYKINAQSSQITKLTEPLGFALQASSPLSSQAFNTLNYYCHEKMEKPDALAFLELEFAKLALDFIYQSYVRFIEIPGFDSSKINVWKKYFSMNEWNRYLFDTLRGKLDNALRPGLNAGVPMLQDLIARDHNRINALEARVAELEAKCRENGIAIEEEGENKRERKEAGLGHTFFATTKKVKLDGKKDALEMEVENSSMRPSNQG